jgi:GntR family transcriptional regulator, carbon starvation induced regulator
MSDVTRSRGIALAETIRSDILLANLLPGLKLTVAMLSERYDCGASPIREALNQLSSDGLVRRIDKRGFYVSETSEVEFRDILYNRCFLESEALRRSIALGGPDWEERVLVAHFRLVSMSRDRAAGRMNEESPDWENAHKRFHMALLSACGSDILQANCEKLYELNNRYRVLSRQMATGPRDIAAEHAAIHDAALARDAERAVSALIEHYQRTGANIFRAD